MQLSVLIPSRNEMFLSRTIEDVLAHSNLDTEVIAVLDGAWADPSVADNPRLTLIHHSRSVGQRAACNEAARLAKGKYVMKLDAHCAVDQGFDVKMLEAMEGHDDWTMVPVMRNHHAFDFVCPEGHRRYQGPSGPCKECGKPTTRDVVWIAKTNPQSTAYCFDPEPHFQYDGNQKERQKTQGDLVETMSLQGSCFLMTRERYFALNVCDESLGSWGSQGIEVACKTWLSGGSVICNKRTWYGHLFRGKGENWSFPYAISGRQTESAKQKVKELFFENKWPLQTRPLSWLLDRFWPIAGWSDEARAKITAAGVAWSEGRTVSVSRHEGPSMPIASTAPAPSDLVIPSAVTKGLVWYTDNMLDSTILTACQRQLDRCRNGSPLIAVSLKPIEFGDRNIVLDAERGALTMFRQILAGIEASTADVLYLCEHDCVYHPSHFDFVPPRRDTFYYDLNEWAVSADDGRALFYRCQKVSMLCANRELLLEHYRTRVARVEKEGFTLRLGYEPGNHPFPRGVDMHGREDYWAAGASIDIRHKQTFTPNRFRKDQFRNQRNLAEWTEADEVPGWGVTKGRFNEFMQQLI